MRDFLRSAALVAPVLVMTGCQPNESAGEEGAAVEADVTERLVATDSAIPQSPVDDGRPMDYMTTVWGIAWTCRGRGGWGRRG